MFWIRFYSIGLFSGQYKLHGMVKFILIREQETSCHAAPPAILYANQIVHLFFLDMSKDVIGFIPSVSDKNGFLLSTVTVDHLSHCKGFIFFPCRLYHNIGIALLAQVIKRVQVDLVKAPICWQ